MTRQWIQLYESVVWAQCLPDPEPEPVAFTSWNDGLLLLWWFGSLNMFHTETETSLFLAFEGVYSIFLTCDEALFVLFSNVHHSSWMTALCSRLSLRVYAWIYAFILSRLTKTSSPALCWLLEVQNWIKRSVVINFHVSVWFDKSCDSEKNKNRSGWENRIHKWWLHSSFHQIFMFMRVPSFF